MKSKGRRIVDVELEETFKIQKSKKLKKKATNETRIE